MSDDEKPKGLDLSRLLAKKKPDVAKASEPEPPKAEAAQEPVKKPGLDLSKLMNKAKAAQTTEQSAPPPNAKPEDTPDAEPTPKRETKPTTPSGELVGDASTLDVLFGKPAAAPAKPAARPPIAKPTPPPKPPAPVVAKPVAVPPAKPVVPPKTPTTVIEAAGDSLVTPPSLTARKAGDEMVDADLQKSVTPFQASVDQKLSREGAKGLKLDMTVATERKYPLGFFGVNEVMLMGDIYIKIVRANLWRLKPRYPTGVRLGVRITGAQFLNLSLIWSPGDKDVTEIMGELPTDPTLTIFIDTDTLIDNVRGKEGCEMQHSRNLARYEGDLELPFWLGLDIRQAFSKDDKASALERELADREVWTTAIKRAADEIDSFSAYIEIQTRRYARQLQEPVFMRAIFDGSPTTDVLYHYQDRKLTVLRGKPGETLPQGAVELHVNATAMRAMRDLEANLYFLIQCMHVRVSGDPSALKELGVFTSDDPIKTIRHIMKTGQPLGWENRRPSSIVLDAPAKDPYAWL